MESLSSAAKQWKANVAKTRERLVVPADPTAASKLAARYHNPALGGIVVSTANGSTVFDFGEWKSAVASRNNDDGTISFRTIGPGLAGFEFVVAGNSLVLRDSQHEYVFTPQPSTTSSNAPRSR
jgi:hypothetical protein